MEVLGFPYLLHHKQLADQFVDGIIAVLKFSYPLKLEEKLPGAYLLLIHPNEKVHYSGHSTSKHAFFNCLIFLWILCISLGISLLVWPLFSPHEFVPVSKYLMSINVE